MFDFNQLTAVRRIALVAFVLAFAVTAAPGCEDSAGIGVRRAKIEVAPNPVDFDTVPLGVRAERTVTITNGGDSTLSLQGVVWTANTSGDFSLVNVDGLPDKIEPNGTSTFVVAFTPSSLNEIDAMLRFESDDPDRPKLDIAVNGKRRQGPVLVTCVQSSDIPIAPKCEQPPMIDFGDVNIGETFEAKLILRSEGTDPVSITALAIGANTANTFTIETASTAFDLPVGARHEVIVRYKPIEQLPAEGTIEIAASDPENQAVSAALKANGTEAWLCIDPRTLNFENVGVGQTREETIKVSNCGTGDTVRLEKLEILEPSGAFSIVNPLPAPFDLPAIDGVAYQAKIKFSPTTQGGHTARFRAYADRGRATAELTGNSAGCLITPFPTRIELSVDMPSTRTVTFQNAGGEACKLDKLTIDPPIGFGFFTMTNVENAVLEPGDALLVEVSAFPTQENTQSDLTLTYRPETNLAAAPSDATITLVGTSIGEPQPCAPRLLPSSVRFGSIPVGSERSIGLSRDDPCIDEVIMAAGSNAAFTVSAQDGFHLIRFAPTLPGAATGFATIKMRDVAVADVTVEVSGYAGTTSICVMPENIDFGDVQNEATQSFSISACGNESVTVQNLQWTRSDGEITLVAAPALPFTLAAGNTQTIAVRYAPLDNGGDTAVLEVSSDDPVRPSVDVRVTGGPSIVPVSAGRFLYFWQIGFESNVMRQPLQGDRTVEPFAGRDAGNAGCAGCHSVSPDGRFVAVSDTSFSLRFFDAQTKSEFVAPLSLDSGMYLSWNPNVTTVPPYQFVYTDGSDILKGSLFQGVLGALSGASESNRIETMPSWGPNGNVAFVVGTDGGDGIGGGPGTAGAVDVMIVPETGGTATLLAGASANSQGNFYPAFSPNGLWIAITQSAMAASTISPSDGRIRLVAADNSGTVQVLDNVNGTNGSSSYPTWARDGTFISFSSTRVGGRGSWDIYLAPVDPITGVTGAPFGLDDANTTFFEHAAQWSP